VAGITGTYIADSRPQTSNKASYEIGVDLPQARRGGRVDDEPGSAVQVTIVNSTTSCLPG
jgi:hypothetical protein